MDQTLIALKGILLSAVPTLVLVFLLHFYLKRIFFRPMEKLLHERREATEGARQSAEQSFAAAESKAAQYEAALREARGEIYREQEQLRRTLRDEQSAAVAEARAKAGQMVEEARQQLAADAAAARRSLESESEALSDLIAQRVLRGSVRS